MKPTFIRRITHEATLRVTNNLTVPHGSPHFTAFSDMPPGLRDGLPVGFSEATCIACIGPHLDEGEHAVGTHVDVAHVAATPVGLGASVRWRFTEVERRSLVFEMEASDASGPIGSGMPRRVVIHAVRFVTKISEKAIA